MTPSVLGTLTIGQTPRPDVLPFFAAQMPVGVAHLHRGLLDGLDAAETDARYGARDGPRLVTRLRDGRAVELDAAAVEAGVGAALQALEDDGCTVVVLLCTGTFTGLGLRRALLVEPDRVVPPIIAGLAGPRRVGVIVPLPSQIDGEAAKWSALAAPPVTAAASPYAADGGGIATAARTLQDEGAGIVVMDCIGYTEFHRAAARAAIEVPVLLSSDLVARVVGACLTGSPP
jgi:protein AroM